MTPADDPRTHQRLRLAARMDAIEPFHVMEIQRRAFELEASGRRIVHMEIGQPDFPAPQPVVEAAIAALRREPMGYTDALGIRPLREAISQFYADRYRLNVAPERIVVTAGASGAFLVAMGSLIGPGDEVLMPDPCYPCNRHFVRMFEGHAKTIPADETAHYQLSLADVRRHWGPRTRGVMLASPSNPTGYRRAARRAARNHRRGRSARGVRARRRDLPGTDLRRPASPDRARLLGARVRREQLFEVFLHDRLAARVAGRAARTTCARWSAWRRTRSSACPRPPSTRRWRRSRRRRSRSWKSAGRSSDGGATSWCRRSARSGSTCR